MKRRDVNSHRAKIKVGDYTISGVSTAGIETSLRVHELGLCFDIGGCVVQHACVANLLVTHGHADHVGGVIQYLGLRKLMSMPTATIFVSSRIVADLRAMIEAAERIQNGPLDYRLVACEPGVDVPYRGNLVIRPFASVHVVPTLGYTVVERRTKLRDEFRDLPGADIARLRTSGRSDVFRIEEVPLLTFTGDTRPAVIEREPLVRNSRVLLMETSFLDARKSLKAARAGGHIHLDELLQLAHLLENEHIVLTHFSQIYSPAEVVEIMDQRLPLQMRCRTHPFTSGSCVSL